MVGDKDAVTMMASVDCGLTKRWCDDLNFRWFGRDLRRIAFALEEALNQFQRASVQRCHNTKEAILRQIKNVSRMIFLSSSPVLQSDEPVSLTWPSCYLCQSWDISPISGVAGVS